MLEPGKNREHRHRNNLPGTPLTHKINPLAGYVDRIGRMSAELSRFLGFAFANADVLIEVRAGGTISFATGAVQIAWACT